MEFELIRSRRRSLEVRVFPDGRVQVRAPLRLARYRVEAFVRERDGWIRQQRERLAEQPRPRWRHGDSCLHLGETLQMHLVSAARCQVHLQGRELRVALADVDDEVQVQNAVEQWWRKLARTVFQESIERQFGWFAERGHAMPVLRVKRMRTRWGSLSQRGYINLSLMLMRYPLEVIDYVVMHELCHLEYMHHGPQFHALMDQRMPDWRERKKRLDS